MKLVTFSDNGVAKVGALFDDTVVDLAQLAATAGRPTAPLQSMRTLLTALGNDFSGLATLIAHRGRQDAERPLAGVTLLPPVTDPGKVIALGRNYAAHAREGGAEPPDYPMLFHKTAGALIGHQGTIIIPPVTQKVDYEGELAVIIGRTCYQVTAAAALSYVAGYSIANDVSARDLQRRTSQFTAGKMLDTFGPLGPALVTADEIPDPGRLTIRTTLNGQVMQDDSTANMIFDLPFTISYISQIATLYPGDVIFTGTPEGVGFARQPPVFLQDGDTVSVEISGLGTLTNRVKNQ